MWSTAKDLREAREALREIEDIADSAGNPGEHLLEIKAIAREVLE